MIRVYIPSIGENDIKKFEVQVASINSNSNEVSITGSVGNEIIDAVSLATAILYFDVLNLGIQLSNKKFHFHFTDGTFIKDGSSAGLGIFISLLNSIGFFHCDKDYNLLITGEIDLYGNICSIGGIKDKMRLLKEYNFDYFIMPKENVHEIDAIAEEISNKVIVSDSLSDLLIILKKILLSQ